MQSIIPDLVKGSTEGVQRMLPSGEKVRIFLDVLGFIGDYPASCYFIESKTHTASAQCTLCNFKRYFGPQTRASKFGYTVAVNANNSSALRCGYGQGALREGGIDDETARTLGMTSTSIVDDRNCPLLALQREMKKHRGREIRSSENETIVPAIFDAYRSNLVALDHLLTGLAKNVLSLILEPTPTGLRSHVDIKICDELKRNGLLQQGTMLKSNGKGLASMSLSGVFCTLAVAVPVIRIKCQGSEGIGSDLASAMALAQKLLTLINRTYWSPQLHIDGHIAVRRREEGNGELYFADLRRRAVDYIQSANDLCTVSTIVAKHLDKPNLHRLLELYTHTLPALGHVNHFMELVFETAHQPLKRCIVRGNHRDDRLSAAEHSLGNDWQARLMLLRREVEISDQSVRRSVMRGLRRLLLGKGREEDEGMDDEEIDSSLLEVFKEPVIHMLLLQSGPMNLPSKETGVWLGRGKSFKCKGELPGVYT